MHPQLPMLHQWSMLHQLRLRRIAAAVRAVPETEVNLYQITVGIILR